jgi:copper chaperone CopZ
VECVFGVDVYLNMSMAEVRYDRQRVSAKTLAEAVSKAGNDGRHEYRVDLVVEE